MNLQHLELSETTYNALTRCCFNEFDHVRRWVQLGSTFKAIRKWDECIDEDGVYQVALYNTRPNRDHYDLGMVKYYGVPSGNGFPPTRKYWIDTTVLTRYAMAKGMGHRCSCRVCDGQEHGTDSADSSEDEDGPIIIQRKRAKILEEQAEDSEVSAYFSSSGDEDKVPEDPSANLGDVSPTPSQASTSSCTESIINATAPTQIVPQEATQGRSIQLLLKIKIN